MKIDGAGYPAARNIHHTGDAKSAKENWK